jgi:predicted DNA-binding ribbon-helix-helix protein
MPAALKPQAALHPFDSSLETFSIRVDGRWTTVRLEPVQMDALREIAIAEGVGFADLCTRVVESRTKGSMTSALRRYALTYYRDRARTGPLGGLSTLARDLLTYRNLLIETAERDFVIRQNQELNEVYESHPGMALLFSYWRALAKGGTMPAIAEEFDLSPLEKAGFADNVHLIDIAPDRPADFLILRQAPVTMIYKTSDHSRMSRLGDTLYSSAVQSDYAKAKFAGLPTLQKVSVRSQEGDLKYQRIILPCAVASDQVNRLVVGVIPLEPLSPGLPSR